MKIAVMNRLTIQTKDTNIPHIIVSYSDDKKHFVPIKTDDGCKGLMRLEIFDYDGKHTNSLFCDNEKVSERKIFNEAHARNICSFIDKHIDVELIICQCDAGISRSSATAAALSFILNGTDREFFKAPYYPNRLIYRLLLQELNVNNYPNIKELNYFKDV